MTTDEMLWRSAALINLAPADNWRPDASPHDALFLSAMAGINIRHLQGFTIAEPSDGLGGMAKEAHVDDQIGATCRAVLRCAALMHKAREQQAA